jgi:hypothetical protein
MAPSVLMFLMVVVGRTRAGTYAGTNQSAFPTTNQSAGTRAESGSDTDTFRRFLFTRLGIPPLNGSRTGTDRKTDRQQATDQKRRKQFDDIRLLHTPSLQN